MTWQRNWRDLDEVFEKDLKSFGGVRLSRSQEHDICRRRDAGDVRATDDLICSQLQWVVKLANRYVGRGSDVEDLIQAGNLGLLRAARTYSARKSRFSTYCTMMVLHAIHTEIHYRSRTVRVPSYIQSKGGNEDTDAVTKKLVSSGVHTMCDAAKDSLASKEDPFRDVALSDLKERVEIHLRRLHPIDRDIFQGRMNGEKLRTIGKRHGLTRERIRQRFNETCVVLREKVGLAGL